MIKLAFPLGKGDRVTVDEVSPWASEAETIKYRFRERSPTNASEQSKRSLR